MAYYFYLGTMLCPVAPSKLQLKITNQNETMNLMNDGEINILKKPGLTEINFDLLLPNVQYPFATYKSGFVGARVFLDELEKMKVDEEPFQFIVTRTFPDGRVLFDTNMKVSLEEYSITEEAKQGFDVTVSVKLKQYKDYGTKTATISQQGGSTGGSANGNQALNIPVVTVINGRVGVRSPTTTHTVVGGDCLWNIAKTVYGDGSKWKLIAEANPSISNPDLIYPGQVLNIPAL